MANDIPDIDMGELDVDIDDLEKELDEAEKTRTARVA